MDQEGMVMQEETFGPSSNRVKQRRKQCHLVHVVFQARLLTIRLNAFGERQVNMKCRSPARVARDINESAMLFDDPVDDRELNAGPLPLRFCRKERIEDLPDVFFRYSLARIGYREEGINAGNAVAVFFRTKSSFISTQSVLENQLSSSGIASAALVARFMRTRSS